MNTLDHLAGTFGLRPRLGDPLVLATLEDGQLARAASRLVCHREFLLHGRQHVVVERALQGEADGARQSLRPFNRSIVTAVLVTIPGSNIGSRF